MTSCIKTKATAGMSNRKAAKGHPGISVPSRKPSSVARNWQRTRLSARSRFTARMVRFKPNTLTGKTRIRRWDKGKE